MVMKYSVMKNYSVVMMSCVDYKIGVIMMTFVNDLVMSYTSDYEKYCDEKNSTV